MFEIPNKEQQKHDLTIWEQELLYDDAGGNVVYVAPSPLKKLARSALFEINRLWNDPIKPDESPQTETAPGLKPSSRFRSAGQVALLLLNFNLGMPGFYFDASTYTNNSAAFPYQRPDGETNTELLPSPSEDDKNE